MDTTSSIKEWVEKYIHCFGRETPGEAATREI